MANPSYPILKIPGDVLKKDELLGSKPKFWYLVGGTWHMFKRTRPGEDWSEKVAAELANILGIPCAAIEIAANDTAFGITSPTFVPDEAALIHGNELLLARDPAYPADRSYKVMKHTLDNVLEVLESANPEPPMGFAKGGECPSWREVFAGYLLLDALIGNTDRHHENWAMVRLKNRDFLAPSYDHAASLGRHLTDQERQQRLASNDQGYRVSAYVTKALSAFYRCETEGRPMPTLEAFQAIRKRYPGSNVWLERLAKLELAEFRAILERIPPGRISPPAKDFATEMLRVNRERLLSLEN